MTAQRHGATPGHGGEARDALPVGWWRPAVLGSEADGHGDEGPDWARFVTDVVAGVPAEAVVPAREYPGLSGFELLVAPFAERAVRRMCDRLPRRATRLVDLPAVTGALDRRLRESLARTAARTLVWELYRERTEGRLEGGDPGSRFRDFVRRTACRAGLVELVERYPVLGRCLGRFALDASDALAEMLVRLADDRPLLATSPLALPTGDGARLTGIVPAAGDSHNAGRAVTLLDFADGRRIVYKPRPLSVHRHFNELARWFEALPGTPALSTPAVVDRGGYGWVAFVRAEPCSTPEEVERFYRRLGALLALVHAVGGTDVHHENLIAAGEHPVLVDVETLFHPLGTGPADPAERALSESVYRAGMLPQLLLGDDDAVDLSAVGGGLDARSPVHQADWADAGTDLMRLVRRRGRMSPSANRPVLSGAGFADPAAYSAAIRAGHRAGYTALVSAREELLGPGGPLEAFGEDRTRVVIRPTWVYGRLLDESTHPDLMRSATDRDQVLSLVGDGTFGATGFPDLAQEERAQLWGGDIPLFTARAAGTALADADGAPLGAELAASGLAQAAARLRGMGPMDLQDQEWIIRAAMTGATAGPAHTPTSRRRTAVADVAPEPDRLLAAARAVGDLLVSRAYHAEGRCNWLGVELLGDRHWRLAPMGADLAGGYTGPALLLARLGHLTGEARYCEVADAALGAVPGLVDALQGHLGELTAVGSGLFTGLGGIAWAVAECARLLGAPGLDACVPPLLALTAKAAEGERDRGVLGGTAGGLVALLAAHRHSGGAGLWQAAHACADRLRHSPLPRVPGFSQGAAGRGWALLRFAAAGGGDAYRAAGLDALRAAVGCLPVHCPHAEGADCLCHDDSWCQGRAGVALAVADSADALADPALAAWYRDSAARLCGRGRLGDDSACHGETGLLDLFTHMPRRQWVRRLGTLISASEDVTLRCGTPGSVPHPGLLTGLAGIAHGLLRAGFPDRVPSVLLCGGGERHPSPAPENPHHHAER